MPSVCRNNSGVGMLTPSTSKQIHSVCSVGLVAPARDSLQSGALTLPLSKQFPCSACFSIASSISSRLDTCSDTLVKFLTIGYADIVPSALIVLQRASPAERNVKSMVKS